VKKLLVLDIDETLLYSTYENLKRKPDFLFNERKVYLRPHLFEFLDYCFANFEVAVWTSSKSDYAKFILRNILPDNSKLKFLWTRKDCKKKFLFNGFFKEIKYVKDLQQIKGYRIDEIIIIDDTPQNIIPLENILQIEEYRGVQNDDALILMIQKLKQNKCIETL